MAISHPHIREWLRDIHADLEVYFAEFENLGYNSQFLMETDSEDLEQDLKDVVKKVHLRVIMKEHAKLKTLKPNEGAARVSPPFAPQKSAVLQLIPFADEVVDFQPDPQSIGSGCVVLIPIWRLRSIQGKVHPNMIFTSGRHKDSSVYELIHDMLSGRQPPEEIEPLQVVVDEHGLHIVRGHRRGLALCALQGMWRYRTVWAPCRLYHATDPEVADQFARITTMVDGLGVQLHGKLTEAWHLDKPLFRTSQEWCDSMLDVRVEVCKNPEVHPSRWHKSDLPNSRGETFSTSAASSSCAPAQGPELCTPVSHQQEAVAKQRETSFGSKDPKFGWNEENQFHWKSQHDQQDPGVRQDALAPSQDHWRTSGWTKRGAQVSSVSDVSVSMLVCVDYGGKLLCAEVVEVSSPHVKLRYCGPRQEEEWISMDRLQIPDYASSHPGMQVTAWRGNRTYSCHVVEVSQSKDWLRAPVKVRYSSYGSATDEWIGIDRLELEHVKLVAWNDVCKGHQSETAQHPNQEPCDLWAESTVVCCLWLMGSCRSKHSHYHGKRLFVHKDLPGLPCGFNTSCKWKHHQTRTPTTGHVELQAGMVVCVKDGFLRMPGEVLSISSVSTRDPVPLKVRYWARGQVGRCQVGWFPVEEVWVPDYSKIEIGSQATVEDASSGKLFQCTVLRVSDDKDRASAPVYVNYNDYGSNYDEWVGADRFHSHLLILLQPALPNEGTKGPQAPPEGTKGQSGECLQGAQRVTTATCRIEQDPDGMPGAASSAQSSTDEVQRPSVAQDVPSAAVAADLPDASASNAMPWHEPDSEADAFNHALQATEEALSQQAPATHWQPRLERALAAVETEGLRGVLEKHGWSGQQFVDSPELAELLEDLNGVSGLREDSDNDSEADSDPSIPPSNAMESSCVGAPNDWEDRMARQPSVLDYSQQLAGVVVFGTFRPIGGKEVTKRSGEVIVQRGPPALHGCKVKIWCGKNRGPTWDYDKCYVKILDARVLGNSHQPPDGKALDVERMELFGRIVDRMEFGVPRQKLFVRVRPKVVHNARCVTFKPINGKLPAISVPWNTAVELPSGHDLHVVEVLDWNGDRCPRGQYLEDLKMHSRDSDTSILEAVQISLNFCDWPRGDPRSELAVADFPQPMRRRVADSGLTVGIQHPGLPIGMVMSCDQNEFHMHVLDVNAYLDALGMEVEHLVRQRSVGAWFLDHLDNPLEANLPLFPPNIEDQLTFKVGMERPAVSFTFEAAQGKPRVSVSETTVRCDRILNPSEAGEMILSDEGGDFGQVLRRLYSHVVEFRRADLASGSGSVLEHLLVEKEELPGPLVATEQLLQGCMCMVDRHVGAALSADAWNQLLHGEEDGEEDAKLTVRYIQGKADPSTWKVIERLLRVNHNDRDKEIRVADVMRTLRDILQQPGLTNAQKHAMRASFLRRLHAALPAGYYEVAPACEDSRNTSHWWHPEPRFHVTSPLHRYIDILGMRALKCQLGWTASHPHLLLSRRHLEEAVARTNCRMAAESFGRHIFRTISRMRELSGHGQLIKDAVIGAVGPTYINILVPSQTTQTLEMKVPVNALCGSSCVSEYDVATQSLKLTRQNGRDPVHIVRILSWFARRMTCVVARNYAQPIPHHASPNSIVVWEIRFHGEKDVFPTGLQTFPESFPSWPDLTDWPLLDRKMDTYSQVWSRIKLCQVHAAAVASDAYTTAGVVSDLNWFSTSGAWHFECQVDVKLLQYQWLEPGDLAVLSLEREGKCASLQGTLVKIRGKWPNPVEGKSFIVEVELSEISELAWHAQEAFLDGASNWRLHFILIPPNEKKSIQLLQDMQRSCPLQGMRLTVPRSTKEMKREKEMRPLLTKEEVRCAMQSACDAKLNEMQTLAIQRALQRTFSMVQGPPGTGKTSMLVQCVDTLLSAPRPWKKGDGRILVCAPSNHAADHILDRLVSAGIPAHYIVRIYSRGIERSCESKYKGGTTKTERIFEIQPHLEEHALHRKVGESHKVKKLLPANGQETFDKMYEAEELQVLRAARIVITTCTNAYLHTSMVQGEPPHVVRPVSFDSIVIDEAAQASEPDVVLAATSASCRVIVVGDHKQLGPVVPETNLCAPYISALETPFLERMYQNPRRSSASTMLIQQYRMHPSIRSFPSSQFYESMLEDQVSIPHRPQLNCIWPQKKEHRRFIDCRTPQSMGLSPDLHRTCDAALMESKVSLKNVGEARSVVAACKALLRQKCDPRDIAVITPYKAQQHEIRARLEREVGYHSKSILVGTVHALQGSEREYIIVSFVRSTSEDEDVVTSVAKTTGDSVALQEMYAKSLGILENFRVLNVAITRAKYGLICVGNADVLSKGSKDFRDFIHSLRSCKCILSQTEFLASVRAYRASQ